MTSWDKGRIFRAFSVTSWNTGEMFRPQTISKRNEISKRTLTNTIQPISAKVSIRYKSNLLCFLAWSLQFGCTVSWLRSTSNIIWSPLTLPFGFRSSATRIVWTRLTRLCSWEYGFSDNRKRLIVKISLEFLPILPVLQWYETKLNKLARAARKIFQT